MSEFIVTRLKMGYARSWRYYNTSMARLIVTDQLSNVKTGDTYSFPQLFAKGKSLKSV
jgi:hypothetical protein